MDLCVTYITDYTLQLEDCPGTPCQAHLHLTFDLDLGPTWTDVSNGTSTHDGKQLCKFLLKSIQNCRSYGPDKNLTFKCDLDLGSTWMNVSNGTSTHDGEQLCQIILKSIYNCSSYGPEKIRTDRPTHSHTLNSHCDNYVWLTASALNKNMNIYYKGCFDRQYHLDHLVYSITLTKWNILESWNLKKEIFTYILLLNVLKTWLCRHW